VHVIKENGAARDGCKGNYRRCGHDLLEGLIPAGPIAMATFGALAKNTSLEITTTQSDGWYWAGAHVRLEGCIRGELLSSAAESIADVKWRS
jgi:hypothetical protein